MSEQICKNCRWWKELKAFYGDCQRNAPVVLPDGNEPIPGVGSIGHTTVWPETSHNARCGEFEEKK